MKKIIAAVLIVFILCTLCACSEEKEKKISGSKTEHITIDALCVDDDYRDSDNSPLRLVYLFYTLNAGNENLKIDSLHTELKFDDTNAYTSEHIPSACEYAPSYYYSSYIEDVYTNTSLKVVATFKIPETELVSGKTITIEDSQLPDEERLHLKTSDIKHFSGREAVGKAADPEGYAVLQEKREGADAELTAQVKELINGYEWNFYVNSISYKISFREENEFFLETSLGLNNGGTYSIQKGYIFCTYPSNNHTVEIPYEITEGEIDLDLLKAFDVQEG
ncbi:MAG: hypothetical protein E7390_05475 [Ruminococcaceae bacterium]|nr:hypothetical protein [Oscillospiraceae bacterium]